MIPLATQPRNRESTLATARERISVIIPCYNHGAFLADALESVRRQTRPADEVLVIDDGSTDNTAEVAGRDPQVRYIRQSNAGLAAARNRGIEESCGDFLLFLDADDRLTPIALSAGFEALRSNAEWGAVYGDFERIDARGGAIPSAHRLQHQPDMYAALLRNNLIAAHDTVLYRREIFERLGKFDVSLKACEDYEMYLRVAKVFPIGAHDRVVAQIRHHGNNMSSNHSLMLQSATTVLRRERSYCQGNPVYRESLREGLRFWRHLYSSKFGIGTIKSLLRRVSPQPLLERWRRFAPGGVPLGWTRFGSLRRVTPVSPYFGFDRGTPIDRYYIESFLEKSADRIRDRVLEIADATYTKRFGAERVTTSDVLNLSPATGATFVGDLLTAPIPDAIFDCVICTQTLHLIYDCHAALRTLHRILKPGGTLLLTVPGISQLCPDPEKNWTDYWRFTHAAARRIVTEVFPDSLVDSASYGNVFAATAFLQGLAVSEVRVDELDFKDPNYEVIVSIRAQKPV